MPTLIVNRDSGYADSLRAYKLILDGSVIGSIHAGNSMSFEITPGEHSIQAKIDWCSSPPEPFIATEETVTFEVFSKLRGVQLFSAIIAVFKPHAWLGLRRINTLERKPWNSKQQGESGPRE